MAFIQCQFFSEALDLQTGAHVLLPDGKKAKKCLWLLHGRTDGHSVWTRRTSIERYVQDKEIAVIMPDGGLSFYCDMKNGGKYWTFLSEELPSKMHALFQLPTGRQNNFAAGLSMGGYGAFRLALKRPDLISAAVSFSGALDLTKRDDLNDIFGPKASVPASDDLFKLAKLAAGQRSRPKQRFYQCCGTEDFLYQDNLRFRDHALKLGLDLTYTEGPGSHEWGYWDQMFPKALHWLLSPERTRA